MAQALTQAADKAAFSSHVTICFGIHAGRTGSAVFEKPSVTPLHDAFKISYLIHCWIMAMPTSKSARVPRTSYGQSLMVMEQSYHFFPVGLRLSSFHTSLILLGFGMQSPAGGSSFSPGPRGRSARSSMSTTRTRRWT